MLIVLETYNLELVFFFFLALQESGTAKTQFFKLKRTRVLLKLLKVIKSVWDGLQIMEDTTEIIGICSTSSKPSVEFYIFVKCFTELKSLRIPLWTK